MNIPDREFGLFLDSFVKELQYKKIDGENWEDIDNNRHTKDKSLISRIPKRIDERLFDFF